MKRRLYALKHYTESGDLKAPAVLVYILLFLSRTWGLLIISAVSRQTGNELLSLFYPDKTHFYLGLSIGIFPLIIFLISGRRHAQDKWALTCWPICFYLLVISLVSDLALQLYYLTQTHFEYSVAASIQLVIVSWSFIFIVKSNQLKDSFRTVLQRN
ncbi:DUF2919 domain-containing protein [Psychromonas sp.]|nr:DUF2919 domain-containing protein [Psychromonas sp.]